MAPMKYTCVGCYWTCCGCHHGDVDDLVYTPNVKHPPETMVYGCMVYSKPQKDRKVHHQLVSGNWPTSVFCSGLQEDHLMFSHLC